MSTENNIDLKIVTPQGYAFDDKVSFIKFTTAEGEMAFLKGHENFIASLLKGDLLIKKDKEEIDFATVGGTVFFQNDSAVILTPFAAPPEELEEILEERIEMLSKAYDEDAKSGSELQKAEMALRRHLSKKSGTGGYL